MSTARHSEAQHGPHRVTTHDGIRRRMLVALPAAVVVAALIGTPSVAAARTPATVQLAPAPAHAAPGPASQGIIMRDGGLCDPIRNIGC